MKGSLIQGFFTQLEFVFNKLQPSYNYVSAQFSQCFHANLYVVYENCNLSKFILRSELQIYWL
jgi:hypothetical protein